MHLSSKRVLAVAVLVLASCRDLSVPPPPGPVGPGTLSGRAVVSLPGSPLRQAISGASVEVLGNGLSTTTDADGYFQINGITSSAGQVLFRADVDHDGVPDRQRLLTLDALQVGPGKQVSLGDVVLSDNALVRGKVLRGDIADSPTGHAGTLIFVPIGPFTATSGDDGSFVLPELPEGTLSIAFFRQGYAARGLDAVSLSSGQALTLEPIRLALQPGVVNPAPVSGRVLVASGEPAVGAMVALTDGSTTLTTNTDAEGHYTFPLVAGGRYSITAHLGGSGDARFLNLLVTGTPLALPDLVLGALALGTGGGGGSTGGGGGTTGGGGGSDGGGGIVEDSGVDAGIDAGADAGVDAGIDAGVDAGVDAGPVLALPLAPTQVTATLNSTSIDVSWVGVPSVPPTTGYQLRVIPQGGGTAQVFQVGASPYPVQLAGLTLGTTYTFAVSASNVLGPGPEALSASVDYVVLPGPPTGVTAVPGGGAATVSWTPPVSTGGRPLTAYLVTVSPGGQVLTVTAPSTQTTVQNLNNGTQYGFSVVARSTVGDSTPSTSNLVIPQVGNTLTITGGTGQSALPNQFFPQPITFALKTPQNAAVPSTTVTLSVDNGAVVTPASLLTSGAGLGSVAVRAGRKSGVVTLSMFVGGLLLQTVSLTVTVPPPLTVIPIVNADAQSSVSGQLDGPAAQTTLNPGGLAAAPDGTLYVFNRNECTVLKISSDGLSSVVAGTGTCVTTPLVNNLPLATGLTLALRLVFDAPRNTLYVRSATHLIAIPFDGSTTRLLIGGGLGAPTNGDGLLGTSASISSDGDLVQSPDGRYLYFMDPSAKRVRRYDLQTNVVTGQLATASPCSALQPTSSMLAPLAIDSKGRLFMLSAVCGLNYFFLTRWTPGSGTTIQILSGFASGFSNGARAADVLVDSSGKTALAVDAADNIYLNDGASRLYKIDAATGLMSLVMGSAANSVSGNYGPATSATFDLPVPPAPPVFDAAGNLYFAGSTSVRSITQLGASVRTPLAISISAGNGQSGALTSLLGPMQVTLTANGTPLSNATVWWESLTPGSGVLSPGSSQTLAGTATMQARIGQKLGAQTFRAVVRDFYGEDAGTVDFTATSTLPTAGLVTSLVNADRAAAAVKPGAAVTTPMQNLHGLAVGDGGVLYLGLNQGSFDLLRVDPSGDVRSLRSFGPATNTASETAIAVDESRNRLYFAWGAAQIYVLDLTSGLEQLWVGTGFQGTAGDGALGTAATLGADLRMEVDPDGNLFTSDNNTRIRFVTPAGVIDSWVAQPTASNFNSLICTQTFAWALQNESPSTVTGASARNHFIQFDAQKNAYVAAFYCGTSLGLSAYVSGILQITPGGVITEYARFPAGTRGAGLTRDNDGTIYWADFYANATISLWRIDPTAPPRTSVKVVGSGARATGPDFVTGLSTTISPGYVVMLPTHRPAWVDNSRSIRTWW